LSPLAAVFPPHWRKEVNAFSSPKVKSAGRLREMSREIERDFARREMVVGSLLNWDRGCFSRTSSEIFLCRPPRFHRLSTSYAAGTEAGELVFLPKRNYGSTCVAAMCCW